jgi:uncharacterized protein (DUF1778 family)
MATSANRKQPEDQALDEHERMVLIGADRDAFLAAVLEPPEPTEKLVAALRRHRAPLLAPPDLS